MAIPLVLKRTQYPRCKKDEDFMIALWINPIPKKNRNNGGLWECNHPLEANPVLKALVNTS
ncbi:MAG: hypothetical protein Q4Q22_03440 [Methanosphaera sp.]|nr:hypothetical protein [Methanosphaera sp.]